MAYIFDPDVLHSCARTGVGHPVDVGFARVVEALREAYPRYIEPGPLNWILNNAGGAMGQMALLHASLSEYVLLFGTPIGTEGHSGRYATDVYDFVIDGTMWCYLEGEVERSVYEPGAVAFLGQRAVKGYRIPDHCWMLEYARGPIPTMLPFGLADSLLSTLDVKTIGRTLWEYGRLASRSLRDGKI